MKNILQQSGQSLLEVIIAMAVFGLVAASLLSFTVGGDQIIMQGGDQTKAMSLAQAGIEAVRSIRDEAWNELIFNQSAVSNYGTKWSFSGEGTSDTLDKFTRTISFENVCRGNLNQIVACPGTYTDLESKKVISEVVWPVRLGITNSVQRTAYLTNWNSSNWTQTDWSGGGGQSIWSDQSRFDNSDGNISFNTAGQISLAQIGGGFSTSTWSFDVPADYAYDSQKIEVAGSNAQLIASGGGEIDGFVDTVVDSYEFDTSDCDRSSMIKVGEGYYAIAYNGPGTDGWLKTVNIDSSGNIGNSTIDSLEYDTSQSMYPTIIHVSGNIYAIAYQGPGNDGWLKTVSIDTSGNIGNSVIDSLEFDTSNGLQPTIINVSGSIFAIVYGGPGNDGWLKTVSIDTSGNIGNSVIDSYEWDTSNGIQPDIVHISGNVFAITYQGPSADGWIKTITITPNGIITKSTIDSLEFDAADGIFPHPVYVSGTIYALVYQGTGSDGWLKTVSIDTSGNIGNSVIASYEYDPDQAIEPRMISIGNNNFIIVYEDINLYGKAIMLSIGTNGSIGSIMDNMFFDPTNGQQPYILDLGNNYFAISYNGPSADGWLTTVQLSLSSGAYPTDNPTIYPVLSFSNSEILYWNSFTEVAAKNGGEIYYQLSGDNGTTWQYWSGSDWAIAGGSNYNIATVVNTNIDKFSTTSASILFKAFLHSDGTQQIQLDEVSIGYYGSSGSFETSGYLESSAFNLTDNSPVQIIFWDEDISSCMPNCQVRLQVRTAPDASGLPGAWTSWYGASGVNTFFTNASGNIIPKDVNGNQWVQYNLLLTGDGASTPIIREIRVNYK